MAAGNEVDSRSGLTSLTARPSGGNQRAPASARRIQETRDLRIPSTAIRGPLLGLVGSVLSPGEDYGAVSGELVAGEGFEPTTSWV